MHVVLWKHGYPSALSTDGLWFLAWFLFLVGLYVIMRAVVSEVSLFLALLVLGLLLVGSVCGGTFFVCGMLSLVLLDSQRRCP